MLTRIARRISREIESRKFPTYTDDFTKWLRFANPGMLHAGNVDLFAYCIERLPTADPIIEIGSFCGLSVNHIIHLLRKLGRANRVFGADSWCFADAVRGQNIDGSHVAFDAYREHVVTTYRRNVELFSVDQLPYHIQRTSDAFFARWRSGSTDTDFFGRDVELGGPISFAYIDGDHSYEQAKRDFENVSAWLVPGGFVIFDDSEDGGPFGSSEAARDASTTAGFRLVGKNPNYCIQKMPAVR